MNIWILVTVISCLVSSACGIHEAPVSTASAENNIITLKPIPAVLTEERARVVEVINTSIGSSGELDAAQFVDMNNGWARGSRVLYHTSNAGATWNVSDPKLAEDSYITSFFFVDANHGWITVIHKDDTKKYTRGYSSSIMSTNDGGNTWSEQSLFHDEVKLRHVSFVDVNKGIAVGGIVDQKNQAEVIFAVSTNDGGKTWNDIAEHIKPAIKTPYLAGNDSGDKIYWSSSSHVFLLTARDRVLASDDSGETWKSIVHFEEERVFGKSGFYKLLFDPQKLLGVLGGSAGDEGYWGSFVTSDDQIQWQSYELIRVPLIDAIVLSENEILACGLEVKAADTQQPPNGIVLYSKDRGKSWSPVYRTHSNAALISLTRISDTDFYAVSDNGNFTKFRMNK